jgi:hypothetical protein
MKVVRVVGSGDDPIQLGRLHARRALEMGAEKILDDLKNSGIKK